MPVNWSPRIGFSVAIEEKGLGSRHYEQPGLAHGAAVRCECGTRLSTLESQGFALRQPRSLAPRARAYVGPGLIPDLSKLGFPDLANLDGPASQAAPSNRRPPRPARYGRFLG